MNIKKINKFALSGFVLSLINIIFYFGFFLIVIIGALEGAKDSFSLASFILLFSLASVHLLAIIIIPFITIVLASVFSIIGIIQTRKENAEGKNLAIIGLSISVLSVLSFLLVF